MDFYALLRNRRAIRGFQDREVPLDTVKEIIQDTCLAPTASNGQWAIRSAYRNHPKGMLLIS